MAAPGEFELQLGHLCNDRCVFCESGRLTHAGQAPPLPFDVLAEEVKKAHAAGHRRITLLGGEPTLQPAFYEVVRLCVALGYERIVIFSNGSKAGSTDLVDRVIATGGSFEWRFSVQGATREAHERTTGRKGGFDQVLRALSIVRERGQRATVNVCLVRQNCDSVDRFAELLVPLAVAQVHVDVLNPYDTGRLTEEELAAIMPRYGDLVGPLTRMVRAFPDGFEVSIGGLPFCVAPELAPWIHHDHHPMWTVTASESGEPNLKPPRFLARTSHKVKPPSCRTCLFDPHCTGVFRAYADRFGYGELEPVSEERLRTLRTLLVALRMRPILRDVLRDLDPWVADTSVEELNVREVIVSLRGRQGAELRLLFFDGRHEAIAVGDACSLRVHAIGLKPDAAYLTTRNLWSRLELAGLRTIVPPGPDSFLATHPSVGGRLARLRRAAPFGDLTWVETRLAGAGQRAEVLLRGPQGERAAVWLATADGRDTGGYRVEAGEASPALVAGLRDLLVALGRASNAPAGQARRGE
jgi:MoaA/NifB/PqqE/SkfB family radical SAM enzyme